MSNRRITQFHFPSHLLLLLPVKTVTQRNFTMGSPRWHVRVEEEGVRQIFVSGLVNRNDDHRVILEKRPCACKSLRLGNGETLT